MNPVNKKFGTQHKIRLQKSALDFPTTLIPTVLFWVQPQ